MAMKRMQKEAPDLWSQVKQTADTIKKITKEFKPETALIFG